MQEEKAVGLFNLTNQGLKSVQSSVSLIHVTETRQYDSSYLWNCVPVTDHVDNVVQGEEGVTLNLSVDVLAHRAAGQQAD